MTSFKRTQRKYVQKAYRVRNWREYETGLRARGSLTVWLGLTDGKLANWNSPRPTRRKPGRQRKYSWRTRPPSDRALANAVLDAQVAAMHAGSQRSYGRPRIVRGLRAQGVPVSHERVRKSLQRQGLRPVYRRPCRVTTDAAHHKPIAPNVLDRRVNGWHVNQAWVGDITYLATGEGWLYLACVMDLASRRIVGWSMSGASVIKCWRRETKP